MRGRVLLVVNARGGVRLRGLVAKFFPALLAGLMVVAEATAGAEARPDAAARAEGFFVREARGVSVTWHGEGAGRRVSRFSAEAVEARPGQVGAVRVGGVMPVLVRPRLELWVDEVSDAWCAELAKGWGEWAEAARRHTGEWEIVLRREGRPGLRVVSDGWRWRAFAPGVDLLGEGGRRGRAPVASIYWRGPGRGVGYAVGGRPANWDELAAALRASAGAEEILP